jgi:uncharacterized protein YjbI with pentapeptide repeats
MAWAIEHWTILTGAGLGTLAVAALFGAWWLWWRLPKRQVDRLRLTIRDPKARADVEDNFRKTIGQLLGGAAVLIGAALAYLQFSQQQQTSQQQFSQQQQASRDLLISTQVSKGFEQLGSDRVVVRLGGIYALEGVMNNSEQYHKPVLEALSAFVRDGTRDATGDGPPAPDIQAALTVIGRRSAGAGLVGEFRNLVNLVNAHIPKADLRRADLSRADLSRADLSRANLSSADLSDAILYGATLTGATLGRDDLGRGFPFLPGADLSRAILRRANLSGAYLYSANLDGANLDGANLDGAMVSQAALDQACGIDVKLDPGLTLKPC